MISMCLPWLLLYVPMLNSINVILLRLRNILTMLRSLLEKVLIAARVGLIVKILLNCKRKVYSISKYVQYLKMLYRHGLRSTVRKYATFFVLKTSCKVSMGM